MLIVVVYYRVEKTAHTKEKQADASSAQRNSNSCTDYAIGVSSVVLILVVSVIAREIVKMHCVLQIPPHTPHA